MSYVDPFSRWCYADGAIRQIGRTYQIAISVTINKQGRRNYFWCLYRENGSVAMASSCNTLNGAKEDAVDAAKTMLSGIDEGDGLQCHGLGDCTP